MQYAIECQNLHKVYRSLTRPVTTVIDDVSLQVAPGQVYGFLGPNGAGKTTTIRLLVGLVRPTRGEIRLLNQSLQDSPSVLHRVGALIEGPNFYPYLTAWDNLRLLGWTFGAFDEARARMLLERLGLAASAGKTVRTYSTGMRQRLGLVAALMHDPALVILDEPTNGLDPAGLHDMRDFVRQLVDEEGKTVFFSSHQLAEVQQLCDRVAILNHGKLIAEGRVADLLQSETTDEVAIELAPLDQALALLAERWSVRKGRAPQTLILQARRDQVPEIVRTLAAAEIDIFALNYRQRSLEDLFLSATQNEKALA
ncbi:MAG: ABC transporter ATP-binding protein [Anaerolineales bacterium]